MAKEEKIEHMARAGYEIATQDMASDIPDYREWTWDNELEPCKDLWRKVAVRMAEIHAPDFSEN